MVWSAGEIRQLRQRLGWSIAEMARQMGAANKLVEAWEAGESSPDPEVLSQMNYLAGFLDSHSERITQKPLVESLMDQHSLAQMTHDELKQRTK